MDIAAVILGSLTAITVVVAVTGRIARMRLAGHIATSGQRIDVGGRRLHLSVCGAGSPTIVLDAGLGDIGLVWGLVSPELARETRVVVYDRAGSGLSDPTPAHYSIEDMAADLRRALAGAGIAGPLVLVAHSFAGFVTREFARRYADEVAGIVLVDASHEHQMRRFPPALTAKMRPMFEGMLRIAPVLRALDAAGVLALVPGLGSGPAGLPEVDRRRYRAARLSGGNTIRTLIAEQRLAIAMERAPAPASLGEVPLVVISHGRAEPMPGIAPEVAAEQERIWKELQSELAGLSTRGRLVIAEGAGHYVQIDRPDTVIAAVREVLAEDRIARLARAQ